MEIPDAVPSLWPRLQAGAAPHSEPELHRRRLLPLTQQRQQELLRLQQQQKQQDGQQQQLQTLRHSRLLAMQQLLRHAAAAAGDSDALIPPSDGLPIGPQGSPAFILPPPREEPPLVHAVGDVECSSSRSSSRSSSCIPIIVESSSEAYSDSDGEAEGWAEVTLAGSELGAVDGLEVAAVVPPQQRPPCSVSDKPEQRGTHEKATG